MADTTVAKNIPALNAKATNPLEIAQNSVAIYRRLFPYIRPYMTRFVIGGLLGGLFGLTNGLMVLAVKWVGEVVFGEGAEVDDMWVVVGLCGVIPGLMMLRGALSYSSSYCMLWVSMRVLDDIRTDVFNAVMRHSMSFFTKKKSGELIQIVFGRTRAAQQALTQVSTDVVKQPISVIAALGALFYTDWRFTLAAFVLFPLCLLPVFIISKSVRSAGNEEEQQSGALLVTMQEAFAGIRLVKSSGMEEYERKRFAVSSRKTILNGMRWRKAMELVGPLVEAIASLGISAALFYAWYYDIGAAKFMALNGGLILLYPPFKQMSRLHLMMQKCAAASSRVFEIMDLEPEIQDRPDAKTLEKCAGSVAFEGVNFGYDPEKKKNKLALRDFTLDIEPGTTCALVGSSGAGKTTVMSLLLRLWDPQEGTVKVDGHDVRDLTESSLRRHIAIVTQDTFLFHDTIRNNIRYGRLDATDEEVEAAAELANAHGFITKMSGGYDAVAGDKGCMLSGGQQQRISIARALLKDAPVLLLDEATSALDSQSEKAIQDALATLTKGRTVIVIAHRLSTVLKADKIVVMGKGRVKETGTHAELYEKSGVYRKLYDLQFHAHENPAEEAGPVPTKTDEPFDVLEINEV